MAILPISSVSARQNRSSMVSFSGKSEEDSSKIERLPKASAAKAVPVIVLMAMNPSLLNAKEPMKIVPMETGLNKEVLAQLPSEEIPDSTYMSTVSDYHKNIPGIGQWKYLRNHKILMHHIAQGNGTKYHMLFTTGPGDKNSVTSIYFIRDGAKGSDDKTAHPPVVAKFYYHNLGPEKEFCSVKVIESIVDDNGRKNGTMIRQIKIDDDTANKIISLMAGEYPWKDNTMLGLHETKETRMMEPIIQDY